jgi:hypothetical protein
MMNKMCIAVLIVIIFTPLLAVSESRLSERFSLYLPPQASIGSHIFDIATDTPILPTNRIPVGFQDNPNFHFEIGVVDNMIRGDSDSIADSALKLTAGFNLTDWLVLEASYGLGMTINLKNINIFKEAPSFLQSNVFTSISLRPSVKMNDYFEVFGRLGYISYGGASLSDANTDGDNSTVPVGDIKSHGSWGEDFSYGIGVAFCFSDNISTFIDWMHYYDNEHFNISGLGFGTRISF